MDKNTQLCRDLGFLRIGAALPALRVADVDYNVGAIINATRSALNQGVRILAFPEMTITGYRPDDLCKWPKSFIEIFRQPVQEDVLA